MAGVADQVASKVGLETDFDGRGTTDDGKAISRPIVQADPPEQSAAQLLSTRAPIPFIKVLDNSYLSTSPNRDKLPPEIAKLIQ